MHEFHQKIYERAIARLNNKGLDAAIIYILAVADGEPECVEQLISTIKKGKIEPFVSVAVGALKNKRGEFLEKKNSQTLVKIAAKKFSLEKEKQEKAEKEKYEKEFATAERNGLGAVYLASLPPTIRDKIAKPAQKKEAIALRNSSLRSTAVTLELGCSLAELKRWSEDGRLPVLFYRRMQSSGTTLNVRHWAPDVVDAAKSMVSTWREEDKLKKKTAQKKNRP